MSRTALALVSASIALVVPISLLGCSESRECERARMDLSKAWGELREAASRRKLAGADLEAWTFVEERTALLESSFATPQVTWQSAEKARGELNARLGGLPDDPRLQAYKASVGAAGKTQDAYTQKCK